jgi:hypothetical protein
MVSCWSYFTVQPNRVLPRKNHGKRNYADEYLREATMDFTKTPIMPTSGCQLHLPQGTIAHDIKRELKFARSVPPLKDKLKLKYCWSDEEFDDIDWAAHGRAL